jgi:hypothetical protein
MYTMYGECRRHGGCELWVELDGPRMAFLSMLVVVVMVVMIRPSMDRPATRKGGVAWKPVGSIAPLGHFSDPSFIVHCRKTADRPAQYLS